MNIIKKPYDQAANVLTHELTHELEAGPVLLLLSGGSATGIYTQLAKTLQFKLTPGQLVVGLVDERYELDPAHANANDLAIRATGLMTDLEQQGAVYSPILHGLPIEQEVAQYEYQLNQYIVHEKRRIMAVLGIGPDGHIAGILPDPDEKRFAKHFNGEHLVCGYLNNGPFPERISITLATLALVDTAVVLIKDPAKLPVVSSALATPRLPLNQVPATIMQDMKRVILALPDQPVS